ncbi:uncharacterized protein [Littorina saxatilis]|uniref:Uncharacterized protein n=1 Tax=Littorina saxatilis TaxID=31220 RepID=A0AAN9G2F6_9CAEN
MENKRRSAFIAREGIQASLEFLDKHLQSIAIARIVGGVLAAVGAVYMLLWSVGVYSTAQEIGVQLVTLGSVISAVAMGFRLQSNGRASDLLKECHDLLPSTSGVPSSLGNGFRVFSLIRFVLFGLVLVNLFTAQHETGWTVFLSLAQLALNGKKVVTLIRGFQGKTSSQTSKALRQCLQELDKALYCQTP